MLRTKVLDCALALGLLTAAGCPNGVAVGSGGGFFGGGGTGPGAGPVGDEGEGEPQFPTPDATLTVQPGLSLPADGSSAFHLQVQLTAADPQTPLAGRAVSVVFDPAGPDDVVAVAADGDGVADFDVVSSVAGAYDVEVSVDGVVVGSAAVVFDACRSLEDAFVLEAWPTVLSRCVGCHNELGFAPAQGARYVLPFPGDRDFAEKGVRAVADMLAQSAEDGIDLDVAALDDAQRAALHLEDGATTIPLLLANPIFGDVTGHTGGVVVSPDEAAVIARFQSFVRRVQQREQTGEDSCGAGSPHGLVDDDVLRDVTLLSPRQTLLKATLMMTGAPADADDVAAVDDEADLAAAVDALLRDPRVERRLRDVWNDWLLTDQNLKAQLGSLGPAFPDRFFFERLRSEGARGGNSCDDGARACCRVPEDPRNLDDDDDNDVAPKPQNVVCEQHRVQARAMAHSDAIELLQRIWRDDRSADELVTATTTVVNPAYARVLGLLNDDGRTFKDGVTAAFNAVTSDDATEFRVVRVIDTDKNLIHERNDAIDAWPHQGILSTQAFLRRYPTTTSNRERTRARFVYEKLLGVPVMKLAAFATPEIPEGQSLENLTWDTQPCTVCHTLLDPVAGAFNHFTGNGSALTVRRPCRQAGMRAPGFGFVALPGADAPDAGAVRFALDNEDDCAVTADGHGAGPADNRAPRRLNWLADRIVEHPRFSYGVVLPLYEALVGAPIVSAPDALDDPDFAAKARAFATQQRELQSLVAAFDAGQHRLRPVVKALLLGRSFRAAENGAVAVDDESFVRAQELLNVGDHALLTTPEVLDRKITALTGLRWAHLRNPNAAGGLVDDDFYRVFFGGIDSDSVTTRSRDPVAVRAQVARRLGNEVACVVVPQEFSISDPAQRTLFARVGADDVDDAAVRAEVEFLQRRLWNQSDVDPVEVDASVQLFHDVRAALRDPSSGRTPANLPAPCQATAAFVRGAERPAYPGVVGGVAHVAVVADEDFVVRAWMAVVSSLLADGRFLFE